MYTHHIKWSKSKAEKGAEAFLELKLVIFLFLGLLSENGLYFSSNIKSALLYYGPLVHSNTMFQVIVGENENWNN